MSRPSRLVELLFGDGEAPFTELFTSRRRLRRRLILAELLSEPIGLRRPGEPTRLAPRGNLPPEGV